MSYNFANPNRGDVFVFKTNGIRRIEIGLPEGVESQHYIKRLGGIPGDTLRIAAPDLFINGRKAAQWVFQRVMSRGTLPRIFEHTPISLSLDTKRNLHRPR